MAEVDLCRFLCGYIEVQDKEILKTDRDMAENC